MADNIISSCLVGAISQAGADLTDYAKSKVSLSRTMENNYEMLRNEVARLQALRDDYEREVKKHKMKTTTCCYDVWLRSVNKILHNAKELEVRIEEDHRWLSSRYIHVKQRSNYSAKLVKMREEIQKLVEKGEFTGGFLVDKPIEPFLKVNAPEIKGFPSLQRPLEQVLMELLRNDKLKGSGIWGTLGVGKTTIMQNLNNHDEVAKTFDIVIWANFSSERSEEKLQEDIPFKLFFSLIKFKIFVLI